MPQEKFWFVDDEQQIRWAVRVSYGSRNNGLDSDARIVFTSRDAQIWTVYGLEKAEHELTRYEVLELLGQAKIASLRIRSLAA